MNEHQELLRANENLLRRRAAMPKEPEPVTPREVLNKVLAPAQTKTCQRCGSLFLVEFFLAHAERFTNCPACTQADTDRQSREDADRARQEAADALCPPEYRDTDVEKLPAAEKAKQALAWAYGPKGLILHGTTGRGKTRTAWLVLRQQFLDGHSVQALTSTDLSFHLPALYTTGADAVDSWLKRLCEVDVLLLDDVFKAVLNERCEAFLFALLSGRNEKRHPCITTLNDTGDSLQARLTADRSAPLIRRLKDYATIVNFG